MHAFLKRSMDILVAGVALLIFSPVFIIVPWLIMMDSQGPALFSQERLGKNGRAFKIFKFRTMIVNAEQLEHHSQEVRTWEATGQDPRITRIGRVLRHLHIDEIPQFVNILKGDMSLIGPRPYYVRRYIDDPSLRERLAVRPGAISLAIITGGVLLSEEEIKRYDKKYIEQQSIILDLQILVRGLVLIFTGKRL